MINRDELMKMAREAGFPFNKYGLLQGDEDGEIYADEMFERLSNAILERAAVECEKMDREGVAIWETHVPQQVIRALKTQGE